MNYLKMLSHLYLQVGGAALDYSKALSADATALDALTSKFNSSWNANTIEMLKDITNVLGVKLCYPFLFAVYRKYADSPSELEKYVRLIMNFSFRYLKVIDGGIETLAHAVNEAALLVNSGNTFADVSHIFRECAPDSTFIKELETASFSNTKLAYFVVYYLEKIQMVGSGAGPLLHGIEQNLEHIMPKTLSKSEWPIILLDKTQNPDLFKENLWRVDNLLPLPESINKSLKNKGITHKITNGYTLQVVMLMSPGEVSNYLDGGEWTYKSIDDRQKDIVTKYAVKAWEI